MTRIVTTHYRYKPPPKRKKPVVLEQAVLTVSDRKRRKASPDVRVFEATRSTDTRASVDPSVASSGPAEKVSDDRTLSSNTDRKPTSADDVPKSAVVTIRRKSRFGRAEDITVDEANRRAKLADDMMQDFKRQIAEKIRK